MFRNYIKTAWRNLRRNKIYSIINVLGLSIGLAAAMLIVLYVKDEVSYDRFHSNADQLYRVVRQNVDKDGNIKSKDGNTGFLQGPRFTENIPEIKNFTRVQSGSVDLKKGTDIQSRDLLYVDSSFFSLFQFPLLAGNPRTCLIRPDAVVISAKEAIKQFGTTDVVGKTLLFRKDSSYSAREITAVAKNIPQNSSLKFDILLPFIETREDALNDENWFNFFLNTFVVVPNKFDPAQLQQKMTQFYQQDAAQARKAITEKFGIDENSEEYFLQPLLDMHLNPELPPQNGLSDASNPTYSYILTGIAAFILLIACINFINLTVARSVRRAREIGVRKVIGGSRGQLIGQFLGESFFLSFFAFLFAFLLLQLSLPFFNQIFNKALALSYLLDTNLLFLYIGLFLLTGFLAGFYPALVLSGYQPVETLYQRFKLSGKNYLQRGLVVFQFTLASLLIIGTFIIYAQFNFLISQDIGYNDKNLIRTQKYAITPTEASRLRTELTADGTATGMTFKNGGNWGTVARVNGEQQIHFDYETVDENYLPLLEIPLVAGRNFSRDFPSDSSKAVLVNESFVREAGWKNPIGESVNFWYDSNRVYQVVGVVKDYHYNSLNQKIGSQLFTMKATNERANIFIKIPPGTETAALNRLEAVYKKMFPLDPYTYQFVSDINARNYEAEQKWKQVMFFSAILTVFISCIGLFGLSVLAAERRTKEIGVRKVLGASIPRLATILSTDFVRLVLISLVVAVPLSWYAGHKWLENYPYRIQMHWYLFVLAALLILLIAVFTVSFQAIRAAIRNPVKSLRTE